MNGSSTLPTCGQVVCSEAAVYGTMGTPAAGNTPGGRDSAVSWLDKSGNLWLFGGGSVGNSGQLPLFNDLWEYLPSSNEWAWMGGSNGCVPKSITLCFTYGVYGTLGTPAGGNIPGSRSKASSWTDGQGHFWLFGGYGGDATFNDLWEYDPSTAEWTWMGGSDKFDQPGVYGTLGQAGSGNTPGARNSAFNWTDGTGNLWLFGGFGVGTAAGPGGTNYDLNDLWEFNTSTSEWTWMGGSSAANQPGVYGTIGVAAAGNVPSGRSEGVNWTGSNNRFWLFGGDGPNDFWEFSPSANEWTWFGGSSTLPSSGALPGMYGTLGTPAAGNIPGNRTSATSWTDGNGNLWLFGGYGADVNGNIGDLNDLWEYHPPVPSTAAPAFSVAAGTYTAAQAVTITDTTAGASIYYTMDGTMPTASSTLS
jgi:N-acetylneuraminic acid mutarotase